MHGADGLSRGLLFRNGIAPLALPDDLEAKSDSGEVLKQLTIFLAGIASSQTLQKLGVDGDVRGRGHTASVSASVDRSNLAYRDDVVVLAHWGEAAEFGIRCVTPCGKTIQLGPDEVAHIKAVVACDVHMKLAQLLLAQPPTGSGLIALL